MKFSSFADLINQVKGKTNRVVALRNGQITDLDIEEALGMTKAIDEYQFDMSKIL
jgi:6-phosphofructokinase 1